MTCNSLPSTHLIVMRDRLKEFVHGGKFFSSEDVTSLIRGMNSVIALSEDIEDENRVYSRALAASHERLVHGRPMLRLVKNDGGDVA